MMIRFVFSLLLFIIGLLTGSLVTAWTLPPAPAMQLVTQTGSSVAVVHIDGIRNGALVGSVQGSVYLTAGGKAVIPTEGGTFVITDKSVLTNMVEIAVPPGMQFVASKRGKKYYPVTSSQGQKLAPANRIYFPSAEAAEEAGFRP